MRRRDRHNQQVFDGAVLPLPDQCRARQDDRQQSDLIDDLHQRAEPALVECGVESCTQCQLHRQGLRPPITPDKLVHFTHDDLLYIGIAGKGLTHAGGVDIELQRGRASRQHIPLEAGWDDQGESVQTLVQARVQIGITYHGRRSELRGVERGSNPL